MTTIESSEYILYKHKLSNGQIVQMRVQKDPYYDTIRYYICLYINKRGAGYRSYMQTGNCGLQGLLCAKEMVKDVICRAKGITNRRHIILIFADGPKRLNVYGRGLRDIGFTMGRFCRCRCLSLIIPKL